MPIDYKDYHPKWTLIRRLVLRRADNCCEWCGRLNGAILWDEQPGLPLLDKPRKTRGGKVLRIVLTIAHVDADRDNNRFYNLAALCQACHLNHDRSRHEANRKHGRQHTRQSELLTPERLTGYLLLASLQQNRYRPTALDWNRRLAWLQARQHDCIGQRRIPFTTAA